MPCSKIVSPTATFLSAGAEVELVNGERLRCKAVIGCDGAKSFIAAKLGLKPAAYCGEVYYRFAPFHSL